MLGQLFNWTSKGASWWVLWERTLYDPNLSLLSCQDSAGSWGAPDSVGNEYTKLICFEVYDCRDRSIVRHFICSPITLPLSRYLQPLDHEGMDVCVSLSPDSCVSSYFYIPQYPNITFELLLHTFWWVDMISVRIPRMSKPLAL